MSERGNQAHSQYDVLCISRGSGGIGKLCISMFLSGVLQGGIGLTQAMYIDIPFMCPAISNMRYTSTCHHKKVYKFNQHQHLL